jgi:hypothetical protein
MLYVGIDQHRKQLTVHVRDDQVEVVLRRHGRPGPPFGRPGEDRWKTRKTGRRPGRPGPPLEDRGHPLFGFV